MRQSLNESFVRSMLGGIRRCPDCILWTEDNAPINSAIKCNSPLLVAIIAKPSPIYTGPFRNDHITTAETCSVCLPICLSAYLSVCLSVCLPLCLSASLFASLSVCLYFCVPLCLSKSRCVCSSVYLPLFLSAFMSVYLSVCLPVCLSAYTHTQRHNALPASLPASSLSGYLSHFLPVIFVPYNIISVFSSVCLSHFALCLSPSQ